MRLHITTQSYRSACLFLLMAATAIPGSLPAQGFGSGILTGRIVDDRQLSVPDATLTLTRGGVVAVIERAGLDGRFTLPDLPAGDYSLLVEQVGYQPVRFTGLVVVAGGTLRVNLSVERRPPPISGVEVRAYRGAGASTSDRVLIGERLDFLSRFGDATDLGRDLSGLATAFDGRGGLSLAANGSLPGTNMLMVDGVEEALLRHPGLPGEPIAAPLFARRDHLQARVEMFALDAEWPSASGASLSLFSAAGAEGDGVRPYLSWSGAALGGAAEDNPADSSGSSLAAGVRLGGQIKGDDASWGVNLGFERRQEPGPAAFVGGGTELLDALNGAAGSTDIGSAISPTVHSWEGFTGSGQLSWRPGERSRITARIGATSWDEDAPRLGLAVSGAGASLNAQDISGAVAFQLSGESWSSVTRAGVRSSTRDWKVSGVGYTGIASEGIAFGAPSSLPGEFTDRTVQLRETLSITSGAHSFKVGGSVANRSLNYDWLIDRNGRSEFGSIDGLAGGIGSWVRSSAGSSADFSVNEFAAFAQDEWQLSPTLTVTVGVRYQGMTLPTDDFVPSEFLAGRLGLVNTIVPASNSSAIGPRAGLRWDANGAGTTVFTLSGGLVPGGYDLAAFAEALRTNGGVNVERQTGAIGWPDAGSAAQTSQSFTLYGDEVRAPRTAVVTASLRQALAPGTVFGITGGYRHTDYLVRRSDLNRPSSPLAYDSDGRAIWGVLEQFDGMIVAAPGSNRRFDDLDHVWGLASTGFADHYEATASIERSLSAGLSVAAAYTWSKTEDNVVGQLSADPADRSAPLDGTATTGDWSEGRSDLDIPGRAVVSIRYKAPGASGLSLGARWRWRSGLPFTPGYRAGVDANGDGSGANDPVPLGSVPGVDALLSAAGCDAGSDGFAGRNSCRGEAVHALDLHLGYRLPISGRGVVLTVDAFNLVSSDVGLIDRAAVLVDPDGSITSNGDGRLSLPLMANDNFGQLLTRRNDPRTIRFGFRVEN